MGVALKVVINAASAKIGGAVNYLEHLLRHLPPRESEYEFFVFLPSETARGLDGVPASIKLCSVPDKKISGWRRVWWEQITLRRFLRRTKVDLLFSTANFAMFRCPVKQILLVRNTLYFSQIYQQTFLPRQSLKMRIAFTLRRWMICRGVKSADCVMTPTQAMLEELRQYVEVPDCKAVVNPYGVEPPDSKGTKPVTRVRGYASVPQRAISLLYISLYAEHKNLMTLLKALPLLNKDRNRKFLLKTTVNPHWEAASRVLTQADDINLAGRQDIAAWVEFAGPLGQKEIEEQYRNADIFVFPSITESFGHPMAEAMAHGLPVVAADTPVNREMCGDAAIYFSPLEPDRLAQAIHLVASDPQLQRKLGLEGRRRVRTTFMWDTHLRRILEIAQAGNPHYEQSPVAAASIERVGRCI